MIAAHRNHPSIISWGVGNELNAQAGETLRYIEAALAYMRELDGSRAANYVSNSFFEDAGRDGTVLGSFMMINEYTGTWMPDCDADEEIQKILEAVPEKPLVPSEFGLCEPAFASGDARREEIFREKMAVYRAYPAIAGTINFCLNDYRTQMGEAGEGKLRQRVHGSTSLGGEPKPSYWAVQEECAPFRLLWEKASMCFLCRKDLPCYTMRGYTAAFYDAEDRLIARRSIPVLHPGERWSPAVSRAKKITVSRPTGDCAGSFQAQV
ncbi:MAG: hypothetical protein HFG26_03775 [Provencibacterium sp.]|nr:hypothetical protein [Provencibacterium sp.]